ncbi:alpha/beta hydrolase [Antribacter gilvus]|uniref:alpha/beta hydrolase n=1 Tax=Antribacter gilvus TaxID=2304675 RepID=UPI000F7A5B60|nr:alpha/beta hydrolase [Antribacter gilvus]
MDHAALTDLRTFYETFGDLPLPAGVRATETTLGGVPALDVRLPGRGAAAPAGTLLYLHGGGYTIGSARTGLPLAARLAAGAALNAVVLDYRLAPEHPYPAAVADALAAYEALVTERDPARVVLAGDSAGAGLALATVVAARDRGLPLPAAVAAFSGWFDLTASGASLTGKEAVDPVFDASDIVDYAATYLAGADADQPLASPLLADLSGLPPLLLQVGTYEVLLDDSTRLAARAAAADVDVLLEVYAGQAHVFQHHHGSEPTAARALESASAFLARAVAR